MRGVYKILSLGISDISPKAVRLDDRLGYIITLSVYLLPSSFMAM